MLLEILTRHYIRRPGLLRRNQDSLQQQTSDDWQQTLLIDYEGQGVAWANHNLADYASELDGDYIWVLDDDDVCADNGLVRDIERIVAEHGPDVIMVRGEWMDQGLIPDDEHWQKAPVFGEIGMSNYIVRNEIWRTDADAFQADAGADYQFISRLFARGCKVHWHNATAFCVPTPSFGRPE